MQSSFLNQCLFLTISISLLTLGFVQPASADVIGTRQMIDAEIHELALSRVEVLLQRHDVAEQLVSLGVDPDIVVARVQNMTPAELVMLEGRISQQIAGGDVIGTVGIVFVVLIILELVGITDIFKAM